MVSSSHRLNQIDTDTTTYFINNININSVFGDISEFLLSEENQDVKKPDFSEFPTVELDIQGIKLNALLDTGSSITCLTESFILDHSENLKDC